MSLLWLGDMFIETCLTETLDNIQICARQSEVAVYRYMYSDGRIKICLPIEIIIDWLYNFNGSITSDDNFGEPEQPNI